MGVRLRTLGWLGALVLFVALSRQLVPAWIQSYELATRLGEQARRAALEHQDPEQVRAAVVELMAQLDIPASANAVEIEPIVGGYRIRVHYRVELRLWRFRWAVQFAPTGSTDSI